MHKISVIIPYYQREPGILRRALVSILSQHLPTEATVEVIVVDDASLAPVEPETVGLEFTAPFSLVLVHQENGGVAKARNAGLQKVDSETRYIAFLDSDDIWLADHLVIGLAALEKGRDFYFCDNRRPGYHESNFQSWGKPVADFIADNPPDTEGIIEISPEKLPFFTLRNFVTQASTTIFRRSVAPDLLFNVEQKNAGEDLVFFLQLASRTTKACFSTRTMVECGEGVNLFFSNFGWDSDGLLKRLIDMIKGHVAVKDYVSLNDEDYCWNKLHIEKLRCDFAFHALRRMARNRRWPVEITEIRQGDKTFSAWFIWACCRVLVGKAVGTYRPT